MWGVRRLRTFLALRVRDCVFVCVFLFGLGTPRKREEEEDKE
jgi:hypothetical protein